MKMNHIMWLMMLHIMVGYCLSHQNMSLLERIKMIHVAKQRLADLRELLWAARVDFEESKKSALNAELAALKAINDYRQESHNATAFEFFVQGI